MKYDATDPGCDKLFKVRDIVEFLVDRLKTVYIPSENISVDEELLLYIKGGGFHLNNIFQVKEQELILEFADNWYTSEELIDYLYENITCTVGNVGKNRLKLPLVRVKSC